MRRIVDGHAVIAPKLDQVAAGGGKIVDVKPEAEAKVADVPKEELKTEPAKKPAAEKKPAASKIETSPHAEALTAVKTPEAYKTHALAWIAAGTEVEPMRAKWSRERIKRGELGVMEEMLIEINKAYTDKIKALQKAVAA